MADPSNDLYECCAVEVKKSKEGYQKHFKQDELLALCGEQSEADSLKGVAGPEKLVPLITELCRAHLFHLAKVGGVSCWKLRPKKVANEIRQLTKDERMVYEVVEQAHQEGIWIRHIKSKTGIKDGPSLEKLLKRLMSLSLIKTIRSAKAGTMKTYMLSYLDPSDEITGGSFYDAGELDESLVDELMNLVLHRVRQESWGVGHKRKRVKRETSPIEIVDDGETAPGAADSRRKKRKSSSGAAVRPVGLEDANHHHKQRSHKHGYDPETDAHPDQLTLPAGHSYPTAASLHGWILGLNIIKGAKAASLTVDEVQSVIKVLVWDDKLEEVNGGYRTVRGTKVSHPSMVPDVEDGADGVGAGNGLTEAPCGRCPVFDICGDGGPINAANCVYFDTWLRQDMAA